MFKTTNLKNYLSFLNFIMTIQTPLHQFGTKGVTYTTNLNSFTSFINKT